MYIGRFAPSPTGPLHFGSLCCALASYADAKANQGQWHLRIEDLDPPRCQPGASEVIIEQLHSHGLVPDSISYQSQHLDRYQSTLEQLITRPNVYYCDCTRKEIVSRGGTEQGYCLSRQEQIDPNDAAIRVRLETQPSWNDLIQGQQQNSHASTELILKRRDGLHAYPLAVVVDDVDLGATHIVRGYDLIDVAAGQIELYKLLNAPVPEFLHIPVAANRFEQKLSKQNKAPALDANDAITHLQLALRHLNQPRNDQLKSVSDMLEFAVEHWRRDLIPSIHSVPAPDHLSYQLE